ncbi:MAG: cohesin domain-containing protein, partial [Oscillospiraceae bacterium]
MKRKIISIMLMVALVATTMISPMAAFALNEPDVGAVASSMALTYTTDKAEYIAGETITVQIKAEGAGTQADGYDISALQLAIPYDPAMFAPVATDNTVFNSTIFTDPAKLTVADANIDGAIGAVTKQVSLVYADTAEIPAVKIATGVQVLATVQFKVLTPATGIIAFGDVSDASFIAGTAKAQYTGVKTAANVTIADYKIAPTINSAPLKANGVYHGTTKIDVVQNDTLFDYTYVLKKGATPVALWEPATSIADSGAYTLAITATSKTGLGAGTIQYPETAFIVDAFLGTVNLTVENNAANCDKGVPYTMDVNLMGFPVDAQVGASVLSFDVVYDKEAFDFSMKDNGPLT